VSVNILACCKCRARAIRRLAYLNDLHRLRESGRNGEPRNASADFELYPEDIAARKLREF
jgi:hypothetical protein